MGVNKIGHPKFSEDTIQCGEIDPHVPFFCAHVLFFDKIGDGHAVLLNLIFGRIAPEPTKPRRVHQSCAMIF
jgi:hypothetical protein